MRSTAQITQPWPHISHLITFSSHPLSTVNKKHFINPSGGFNVPVIHKVSFPWLLRLPRIQFKTLPFLLVFFFFPSSAAPKPSQPLLRCDKPLSLSLRSGFRSCIHCSLPLDRSIRRYDHDPLSDRCHHALQLWPAVCLWTDQRSVSEALRLVLF